MNPTRVVRAATLRAWLFVSVLSHLAMSLSGDFSLPLDKEGNKVGGSGSVVPLFRTNADKWRARAALQTLIPDRPSDMPGLFEDQSHRFDGILEDMPNPIRSLFLCGRGSRGVMPALGYDRSNPDFSRFVVWNTQHCGRSMVCPMCSAYIREARRERLENYLLRASEHGLPMLFATLTIRHTVDDHLADLLNVLRDVWKRVTYHASFKRARKDLGAIGFVGSIEVTRGVNGWHPHLHIVLIPGIGKPDVKDFRPASQTELELLGRMVTRLWHVTVKGLGYDSEDTGQKVVSTFDSSGIAAYLAKEDASKGDELRRFKGLSNEIARGDRKRGRGLSMSPLELGLAAAAGDEEAKRLWWEYEECIRGVRWWRVSHRLRDRLCMKPDEDDTRDGVSIAQEREDQGTPVAFVAVEAYRRLSMDPQLLWECADTFATGTDEDIVAFLSDHLDDEEWVFYDEVDDYTRNVTELIRGKTDKRVRAIVDDAQRIKRLEHAEVRRIHDFLYDSPKAVPYELVDDWPEMPSPYDDPPEYL